MLGSSVLDIGIGLVFVYLILSLVCTSANELLASLFGWRANDLREGLRNLLDGPMPLSSEWVDKLYAHPLIQGLYKPGGRPSYIPSRTFALALSDLVLPPGTPGVESTPADIRAAIDASPCPAGLKQVLRVLLNEAERTSIAGQKLRLEGVLDIQKIDSAFVHLHRHIEVWFNNAMERVSGWYKRRVQAVTLIIALVLIAGLNADSVMIARHLARDSALRAALVAQAEEAAHVSVDAPLQTGKAAAMEERIDSLKSIGIPLGWPDPDPGPRNVSWVLLKICGILLTAGAASLGAPFWFDVLSRFVSVRASGKAPEEAPLPPRQIPIPAPPGPPPADVPVAARG